MSLTEADIKRIVRETLQEERKEYEAAEDSHVVKTVAAILGGFGIDAEERKDIKADFHYARRLRLASERVTGMTLTAAVTLLVGAVGSVLYLGLKAVLGK
jgi:hypothetical protein